MRNPATEETRGFYLTFRRLYVPAQVTAGAPRLDAGNVGEFQGVTGGDFLATLTVRPGRYFIVIRYYNYWGTIKTPAGVSWRHFGGFLATFWGFLGDKGTRNPLRLRALRASKTFIYFIYTIKCIIGALLAYANALLLLPLRKNKHGVTGFSPYPWDVAGNSSTPGHLNPWTTWTEADDTNRRTHGTGGAVRE